MEIEVVHLEGCSATPATIARVKEVARRLGLETDIRVIVVRTPEEAELYGHIGSPTVRVNGLDMEPQARDIHQFGLS